MKHVEKIFFYREGEIVTTSALYILIRPLFTFDHDGTALTFHN